MTRTLFRVAGLVLGLLPSTACADAFDNYLNPILAKVPAAAGVKEIKQLTPALIADNSRVLPNTTEAFVVVKTNEGRYAKLLVQTARQKTAAGSLVPILLIERYVTFKEGEERAVQAAGKNVKLFSDFQFNLDIGQVVPASVGGDLHFVAGKGKNYLAPVGKAKIYLLTKPLPEAAPGKGTKFVVGAAFEARYFNGTYQLHDDGRRAGTLHLKVGAKNEMTGTYISAKNGRKYPVKGKIGTPPYSVQFTIIFPAAKQVFQGWMFTGDGKAIAGSSRLQERDTGFYAVRVEEKD